MDALSDCPRVSLAMGGRYWYRIILVFREGEEIRGYCVRDPESDIRPEITWVRDRNPERTRDIALTAWRDRAGISWEEWISELERMGRC